MSNDQKLKELLKQRGLDMEKTYSRTTEEIPAPPSGFTKLMDTYYLLKNTADMEIPYWYNRVWWETTEKLQLFVVLKLWPQHSLM